MRRIQVHGHTVDEALAGQRTALALHGVEREQIERGDWVIAPESLRASATLDVRFELLDDVPRPWPRQSRIRFHLGASEIIGRLLLLDAAELAPGGSALAQLRLERPTVAARGDRFVIRAYSPSRTIGGGSVIEPVASKRRRGGGVEELAAFETGSLEARMLQRLGDERSLVATAKVAQAMSEPEAAASAALGRLQDAGVVEPVAGRWLVRAGTRRQRRSSAGARVRHAFRRYGVPETAEERARGARRGAVRRRVRCARARGRSSSAATACAPRMRRGSLPPRRCVLERLEQELEAAGFGVPETALWSARLGAPAGEVAGLGYFLGRLVRVSQEYTLTARQLDELRGRIAAHFRRNTALTVADFKELAGVSRKWGVPLLEHSDRVGWTARVGDERRKGPRLEG